MLVYAFVTFRKVCPINLNPVRVTDINGHHIVHSAYGVSRHNGNA